MKLFPGRNAYMLVLAVILTDIVWLGVTNISLPLTQLIFPAVEVAVLLLLSKVIERGRFSSAALAKTSDRLVYATQGIAFLTVAWIAIRVLNHVSMSTDYPYTDQMLSVWDSRLSLDWHAYFRLVQSHGFVQFLLSNSYTSLSAVSCVGFFLMILNQDMKRAVFFLECFMVTALVCTVAGIFFPATGSVETYIGSVTHISGFKDVPGLFHMESLTALRSGQPVALDIYNLPGLTTFPSFHMAAGIVLLLSFWRTSLFPAVLAYVAVMSASIPVFGGHYFIDLIAGTAVAIVICAIFAALPYYRGLFDSVGVGEGRRWAKGYAGSLP